MCLTLIILPVMSLILLCPPPPSLSLSLSLSLYRDAKNNVQITLSVSLFVGHGNTLSDATCIS